VAGTAGVVGMTGMAGEALAAKKVATKGHEVDDFAKRVGSKFVVAGSKRCATTVPGNQVALVLESATARELRKGDVRLKGELTWVNGGNRLRLKPFCLLFSAPGGEQLEQGTYVAAHRDFKKFYLFLVPVPFKEDGTPYEEPHYFACFN